MISQYTEDENRWTVVSRKSGYARTNFALKLLWEVTCDPISDVYSPSEITAAELFDQWEEYVQGDGDDLRIYWLVVGAGFAEASPFDTDTGSTYDTYFYPPEHTTTGMPINWVRVPVADKLWRTNNMGSKGGFIQEATGWKPSPMQPTVSRRFLRDCRWAMRPDKVRRPVFDD